MTHVVVVGAGQAGAACVAKLRALGFEGQITLVGAEAVPPYQRPPLSKKYLLGEMDVERLFLRPESFYAEQNIDLRLNSEVTSIDPAAKSLSIGEDVLAYDELVLATGASPNRLPDSIGGNLAGVYVVRDLDDVDAMAPEFSEGKRVLIVGGGYIGLEAAAVAASKGLEVTLVEMSDRILQRVAAPETSDFFRDLHRKHGVRIVEGVGLQQLDGTGRVEAARLTNGETLAVDFVIVGVGVQPNVGLASAIGAELENGIQTDAFGRTSVAHVWSAGDCASFPYKGTQIRLESVPNAIEQSEVVAENILGAEKSYIAKPWFWSDQYDVKLQIAGWNAGYDRVVTRSTSDSVKSFWYYTGETLVAVDAANAPRDYMVGKRLIESGKSPSSDLVQDLTVDIKDLLRA
ncbi:NAD(P)/FAD-dependent oxidoreductase [Shimia marina]|uniref:Ferredoxin--NAD(P)(+) reductase fdr n=1 Tax=Shimia marina TaxID=321267 RepID=A0A0P1F8K4_9RHOB|nr:FAD-dependent oxidoreductase [Shimia marina]CUH51013.1 Ferredoxin--NAD(P)(+) reductase fdr [Shimia marina]SFD60356.1 3-phenylpropionate/trans-cinnamate dioxygenase ferredoxin reductase subunit [Shimia marina]